MTPEQLHAIQGTIAESIEKNVNGKIKAIDVKIDTYIREDKEYNERMEEETAKWREMAEENLKAVSDVRSFGKVGMRLLAVVAALGGAWVIISKWFK